MITSRIENNSCKFLDVCVNRMKRKKFFAFLSKVGESTEDPAGTKKGVNVVLPCYLTNVHRPRSAGTVKETSTVE